MNRSSFPDPWCQRFVEANKKQSTPTSNFSQIWLRLIPRKDHGSAHGAPLGLR